MTVFLLRHGQTRGNLERRYTGSTEPLCPQGKAELEGVRPPEAEYVYVSPMIRCRETAAILYPGMEHIAVPGFRETGFGIFEGHTYEELKETPAYRAWLDTAGAVPPRRREQGGGPAAGDGGLSLPGGRPWAGGPGGPCGPRGNYHDPA